MAWNMETRNFLMIIIHSIAMVQRTKMKIGVAGENLYFKRSMTYCTLDKMLKIKIYLIRACN